MKEPREVDFSNLDKSLDPIKAFNTMLIPAYYSYLNMSDENIGGQYTLRGVAMQCSGLLFNYRDYLKTIYKNGEMKHENIESACPDWGLIRDISNAEKHFILDNPPGKYIKDITDVQEAMVHDIFLMPNDQHYIRYHIRVMVLLKDYKIRDLLDVATNVLNFWGNFLLSKGAIKNYENFRYKGDDFLTEEQAEAMSDTLVHTLDCDAVNMPLIGLSRNYNIDENSFDERYYIFHDK